jgi:3-oxoacyl-(acyl-carrier-protein) synthase
MTNRVFVTGMGVITAIGYNVMENMTAIENHESGLDNLSPLDADRENSPPICRVMQSTEDLKKAAGCPNSTEVSRTAVLGLTAAREAFESAGLTQDDLSSCGLISANSVGGMDRSECFYPAFLKNEKGGRLRDVAGHTCARSSHFIADQLKLKSLVSTISTACSSSANAIMFGARLIRHKRLDRVIAGGCDAMTRFTVNGFSSLKILDPRGCRPFDEERAGLNLGEGAGFLVLESEESVIASKKKPFCEVTGFANTCDAYHQTASSPEGDGSYLAMSKAMAEAGLEASDIDYVNAHGTGTRNNDLSEGKALERLFGSSTPPISSTKPFTGHTLGAAGGVEAVFSCLSILHGIVYPNLRWSTPMSELGFNPATRYLTGRNIKNVMSNSFGFGGNDTSLIFSGC